MNESRIYLSPPHVGQEEIAQVTRLLNTGWVAPAGPVLDDFEATLRQKFGYPHVLAVSSGTAALHLAVILAGVGKSDRVLVGSLTFVAAANVVLYQGAIPVFLDSERASWNICPSLLEDYLAKSQDPLPKALIVTHIFGRPAEMVKINAICRKYGIIVIEDAAEAIGAKTEGEYVGGIGDFGVLSFNGNKTVTTGGGGALICKHEKDYRQAKFLAEQAKDSALFYLHSQLGYNYRLSGPLAAIGLAQLRKLDNFLKRKIEIYHLYQELLAPIFFEFPSSISGESHWLSVVLLRREADCTPDHVITALAEANIEARRVWKPLHTQPLFADNESVSNGVSEDLFSRGICLPSGVGLSDADQLRVVAAIEKALYQN